MITCLLIQITRNPQGLQVCRESVISGETLQIGRGAACKIHLPDHRVNLLHATIRHSEDGTLFLDGQKDVASNINGYISQDAALPPGTHIKIGPYLLIVEPFPNGHDIALSVELIDKVPTPGLEQQNSPLTLAALNFSKRKLGFGLAACILFLFMLLPLLPSASSEIDRIQSALPVTLTESWNPGPLSGGHETFGSKCSSCHEHAFRGVADAACEHCHTQIKQHLNADTLHTGKFKNSHCTDCHRDHKHDKNLLKQNTSECVTCHGKLKSVKADTRLGDVHDFSSDHPPFHLTLLEGKKRIRAKENDKLIEKSGLKYSHKVHLIKTGISTPQGDTILKCENCHKLEDSGLHFAPMTMENTCQQSECHTLFFADPADGTVPHGSERAVVERLSTFYLKWLPANRTACKQGVELMDCAGLLARENAEKSLFNLKAIQTDEQGCGECHEIAPSGDKEVPWKVTPLKINRDWQPAATFNHARHLTTACTECHDKINSKTSADIAMPGIKKCRTCHAGNQPERDKVISPCASCHKFHRMEKKPVE